MKQICVYNKLFFCRRGANRYIEEKFEQIMAVESGKQTRTYKCKFERRRISQEIDSEYEEEREKIQMNEIINKERQQLEEDVIMEVDSDYEKTELNLNSTFNEKNCNQSLNRSGLALITTPVNETSTQTDDVIFCRPKLHINERVCSEEIKATCANLSSVCGMSVENSRLAVKTVSKFLYKHEVYLTVEEADKAVAEETEPPKKEENHW